MNETFEVGEIAILNKPNSSWHGTEVIIAGPIHWTGWISIETGETHSPEPCYSVSGPDFLPGCVCPPRFLRKRKPPEQKREQLGEWELCPWRPNTAPVTERA